MPDLIVYAVVTVEDARGCENLQIVFSSLEKAEAYIYEDLQPHYGGIIKKTNNKRYYFNGENYKWGYHAIMPMRVDDCILDWDEVDHA